MIEKKLSKFCRDNNLYTKQFISFLLKEEFFIETKKLNKDTGKFKFTINKEKNWEKYGCLNIDEQGSSVITIYEEEMLKYLQNKNQLEEVIIKEEDKHFNQINDLKVKKEKLLSFQDKTIMFLDFESMNQNFSEAGFVITKNNKVIDKKYLIKKNLNRRRTKNSIESQKELAKNFHTSIIISDEKTIIEILKQHLKYVDCIVAHNVDSERKILMKYNLDIENIEFICTENLSTSIVDFYTFRGIKKSPNLKELSRYLNKKIHHQYIHYSFYDAVLSMKCFRKLTSMFIKHDIEDFPLKHTLKSKNGHDPYLKMSRKDKLTSKNERKRLIKEYYSSLE